MNPRFFDLTPEKQRNLINAGYKAFAGYPYRKASMAMVAQEAGLSKSLLFYYFQNKQEYYLFLFDHAMAFLGQESAYAAGTELVELFSLVERTVKRRLEMMRDYPCLMKFATRTYYERDETLQAEIERRKGSFTQLGLTGLLERIDRMPFQNPSDAEALVRIILAIAEGCMRGQEELNPEGIAAILPAFRMMLRSLRDHYYKTTARMEDEKQ